MVGDVRHELRVRLPLIPATHDAEANLAIPVLHERGNDRMERALARLERVWLPLLQREQATPVLQHETSAWRHEPGPEPAVVALNQRHDVAVLIDHRHVDRVAALCVGDAREPIGFHLAGGPGRIDRFGATGCARFAEQRFDWNLSTSRKVLIRRVDSGQCGSLPVSAARCCS